MTALIFLSLSLMLLSGLIEAASRHRRQQQTLNISSPVRAETSPPSREYGITMNTSYHENHANSPNSDSTPPIHLSVQLLNLLSDGATDGPCGATLCDLFDLCNSDEICITSPPPECQSRCWRNGSEVTESTTATAGVPPGDITTLRPLEVRTCVDFPGLMCIRGIARDCNNETFSCQCDAGWTGFLCNELCTLPCVHGDCAVTGAGHMFCSCIHTHIGKLCDQLLPETLAVVPPEVTTALESEDIRKCRNFPGVTCVHGVAVHCNDYSEGFKCLCDAGWTGFLCNEACPLPCVHGECIVAQTGHMFCSCEDTYTGKLCDELTPVPQESRRIMDAIFPSAFAVVVILLIVITIIMWRLRVIPILKIIYMFKHYEDEDGREFDAFVSLTSTANTEKFVYGYLQPILENHNFKICLQARGDQAGDVMSKTVLSALEKSRRIIIIITPDYITNEWNRFEYLIAQHETLKLQQRIIPIILEDVDKESVTMDTNLKHILDSINCLRYPKAKLKLITSNTEEIPENIQSRGSNRSVNSTTSFCKSGRSSSTDSVTKEEHKFERKAAQFWKRLVLSMPKKKTQKNISRSFLSTLRHEAKYEINLNHCEEKSRQMRYSNHTSSEFNNFKINFISGIDNNAFCTKSDNARKAKDTTEVGNKEIEC